MTSQNLKKNADYTANPKQNVSLHPVGSCQMFPSRQCSPPNRRVRACLPAGRLPVRQIGGFYICHPTATAQKRHLFLHGYNFMDQNHLKEIHLKRLRFGSDLKAEREVLAAMRKLFGQSVKMETVLDLIDVLGEMLILGSENAARDATLFLNELVKTPGLIQCATLDFEKVLIQIFKEYLLATETRNPHPFFLKMFKKNGYLLIEMLEKQESCSEVHNFLNRILYRLEDCSDRAKKAGIDNLKDIKAALKNRARLLSLAQAGK